VAVVAIPSHDLAGVVDPIGLGTDRAGDVDRGVAAIKVVS
jgi:hypothetical protein